MKKKRGLAVGLCVSLLFLNLSSSSSAASQITGTKCVKAGVFRTAKNVEYQCKKSAKGLRWVPISVKNTPKTTTKPANNASTTTSITLRVAPSSSVPRTTVVTTTTATATTTTAATTTTTIACPTGSYRNTTGGLAQNNLTFPHSESGYFQYAYMQYVGTFTNNTSSSLMVDAVAKISFSPPSSYGISSPQDISLYVSNSSNIPAGATVSVSGSFTGPSSVVPSVQSSSVTVRWNTPSLLAFCPAPSGS